MSKRLTIVGILLLFCISAAPAQTPSSEAMSAARSLVATLKLTDQYEALLPVILLSIKPALVQDRPEIERDYDMMMSTMADAYKPYFNSMVDAAAKMPALFPDDSKTGGDTRALPAIWADKADLNARYAKLGQDATNALAAIKDQASFAATMPPIFKNCGGCHEKYRASEN